jgi:putative Mg2+ transporter-C (MgtC) family protein
MNILVEELLAGLPDKNETIRVIIRLIAATVMGAAIGLQREQVGKPAGLRTHMLVSLGAAVFVIGCVQMGMDLDGLSRVIQGLATGIGFLGGGAILKLTSEKDIQGLTTAAGIWLTAALGVTVGLGGLGIACLGLVLAWIILAVLVRVESRLSKINDSGK